MRNERGPGKWWPRGEAAGPVAGRVRGVVAAALVAAGAGLGACAPKPPPAPPPPQAAALWRDLTYLADPARHGRQLETPGRDSAAAYIARRLVAAGVEPVLEGECEGGSACPPSYSSEFRVRRFEDRGTGINVAGLVPGTDPRLATRYLVVGAHYDHIGTNAELSRDPRFSGVRPGADDNASGTAAMIELARRVARRPLPQPVIFVAFDAEELGLFGSSEFVQHPPVPLDRVDAMLNLDMVGRLHEGRLEVNGVGTDPRFAELLERVNAGGPGLDLDLNAGGGGGRSDHQSFIDAGVPALHFFTGTHPQYHTVGDRVDLINVPGMLRVIDLVEGVLRELSGDGVGSSPGLGPAVAVDSTAADRLVAAIGDFEARLAADVAADGVGSIAAAVVVDHEVVWENALGWADPDRHVAATPETLYRVGSISKSITAMLLMRLVQRGVVALDDPVVEWVPELDRLANRSPSDRAITFRDLASHTAGLAREPGVAFAARGAVRDWEKKLVASLSSTEVVAPPGRAYLYSNIGYAILGLALERAADRPFQDLVEDQVFGPLGMRRSYYQVPRRERARLATGYVNLADGTADPRVPRAEHRGRGYKVPNGGVYSTVGDLARFIMEMTGALGDTLLSPASRAAMLRDRTPGPGGPAGYGLGFQLQEIGGTTVAGHSGAVAGYTAYLAFEPTHRVGVVLLRNYNSGRTNLGAAASGLLLDVVDLTPAAVP